MSQEEVPLERGDCRVVVRAAGMGGRCCGGLIGGGSSDAS